LEVRQESLPTCVLVRLEAVAGGTPCHPWAAYVSPEVRADPEEAIDALFEALKSEARTVGPLSS